MSTWDAPSKNLLFLEKWNISTGLDDVLIDPLKAKLYAYSKISEK